MKKTKKTYVKEVVGEAFECPYCGHDNYTEYGFSVSSIPDVGETFECLSCEKRFLIDGEEWVDG